MTKVLPKVLQGVAVLSVLSFAVMAALVPNAKAGGCCNLLYYSDNPWGSYGSPSSQENFFELRETTTERQHFYKDVDISEEEGDVILMISYVNAAELSDNLDSGFMNINGRPYIYGYTFEGDRITQYMQGPQMIYRGSVEDEWVIAYGIFERGENDDSVRFFLNQAERVGYEPDGRAARFYSPGLFVLDSHQTAMNYVDGFQSWLPNVYEKIEELIDSENVQVDSTRLVATQNDSTVWLVKDGLRRQIINDDIYFTWVNDIGKPQIITESELDAIPDGLPALPKDRWVKIESYGVFWSDGESLRDPEPLESISNGLYLPYWFGILYF